MTAPGNPTVHTVMLDCSDPEALTRFWTELLGIGVKGRYPKTVKNRMHLDLEVDGRAEFMQRVIDLGGAKIEEHRSGATSWTVMADPEGNEFCIVERG
jgi:predicted enzyme related to lactoylglutathione lyase